mmetsp:Transcript_53988/g.65174  ORF Transcript_53988/g.65174 Transcript_53988/m.65174 type:complete len:430 (-) Transcript_53988:134-1423(-)
MPMGTAATRRKPFPPPPSPPQLSSLQYQSSERRRSLPDTKTNKSIGRWSCRSGNTVVPRSMSWRRLLILIFLFVNCLCCLLLFLSSRRHEDVVGVPWLTSYLRHSKRHRSTKTALATRDGGHSNYRAAHEIKKSSSSLLSSPISTKRITDPCNETHVPPSAHDAWTALDEIVAKTPRQRQSGGIFLYPRQSSILVALVQSLHDHNSAKNDTIVRVCETGFGAGHSAALFLSSSPAVRIITFDKFDRAYQQPSFEYLSRSFPGRVRRVIGDSCRTVPRYFRDDDGGGAERCDLIHGSSLCHTDNLDLVKFALRSEGIVTSTAMHSISNDRSVYFGSGKAQWRVLREKMCINDIVCFKEEGNVLEKDFIFSRKGASMAHEFCVAKSSGRCHYLDGNDGVADGGGAGRGGRSSLPLWMRADVCLSARIEVPT